MSASSSSSSSGKASPATSHPPAKQSAKQGDEMESKSTPLPAAVIEGVANLNQSADSKEVVGSQEAATYNSHPGGDGTSEVYDAALWEKILDDSHIKLESYGDQHYYPEMSSPLPGFSAQSPTTPSNATPPASTASANWHLPSANLQSAFQPSIDASLMGADLTSILSSQSYSGFTGPSYTVAFESQQDGTPFPLSKPIVRDDGILLVGTEIASSRTTSVKNRIFVTNFLRSSETPQSPSHILVEDEVRDMHWLNPRTAIVAVGKEIQLIQLGDPSTGGPCRLQDPINSVHSDTIRELAVSQQTNSYVLSGGFDETVVLNDLRLQGGPNDSTVVGKFDACDVVSSVRWSPTEAHLSWTTDGGYFQVADFRVRSAQLQIPLSKFLCIDSMGGLFTHEYLSDAIIALGFEQGQIAFVDTRMPRQTSCYAVMQSSLAATGEIRRSKSNKFAIFGLGGFSTAEPSSTANGLDNLMLRQQSHQIPATAYKTSGDFSYETGVHLAVSDNLGVVSVYPDDAAFVASATFNGPSGDTWQLQM